MSKVQPKPAAMGKQPRMKKFEGPKMAVEVPLTIEERTELKEIFEKPVFRKAFSNARMRKPNAFPPGLSTALGDKIAAVQLCRIQGWELFEAALFLQTQDPKQRPIQAEETFPDSAR